MPVSARDGSSAREIARRRRAIRHRDGFVYDGLNVGTTSDIGTDMDRLPTRLLDLRQGRATGRREHHPGATAGRYLGGRETDPARGTGDEDDLLGQRLSAMGYLVSVPSQRHN